MSLSSAEEVLRCRLILMLVADSAIFAHWSLSLCILLLLSLNG